MLVTDLRSLFVRTLVGVGVADAPCDGASGANNWKPPVGAIEAIKELPEESLCGPEWPMGGIVLVLSVKLLLLSNPGGVGLEVVRKYPQ